MPSKYVHTQVGERKLKLSNLEKLLYPALGITKAEVIQYYLAISDYLLKYIKDRPLTLIRFPDGVEGNRFYAKTKPDWTPEWVASKGIQHTDEKIHYIVADEKATIVWLANLAALELHPMQMTVHSMEQPDHFIFDLDPPEGGDFQVVKAIAFKLKQFLTDYGYVPYVKTSGSKGLHIFVPIETKYTHDVMVDSVKALAKVFVAQNMSDCTLAMNKEKRAGKTLIDIFRNHMAHTTVAPYSLRGKPNGSISFPIHWDELEAIDDSRQITLLNYKAYLDQRGDAWQDFYAHKRPLHNDRQAEQSESHEVSQKLNVYFEKRNFDKSPEPKGAANIQGEDNFCIQLHDAQNLHYDLRLQKEGVLLSWAIPKGLPFEKGVKRLAIRTEDHPLKYLEFEGVIPKGEYGAGNMWIFQKGKFDWLEQGDTKYKFQLKAKSYERSYSLYKTKGDQWLIELKEIKDASRVELPLKPMLAGVSRKVPKGSKYLYEVKWDGIRCIFVLAKEGITIYSRSGRDISKQFPELLSPESFDVEGGVFDGEIVALDEQGRPMFSQVISRMHTQGQQSIERLIQKTPVVAYLFDALEIDGVKIVKEPLVKRQAWLKAALKRNPHYVISEAITDGLGLFEATKKMGLEGIMAKDKLAPYTLGQRSDAWLKVKHRETEQCLISGYTKGEGDRAALFGALHLLKPLKDGSFQYMGKVGTGFDSDKMKYLLEKLESYIIAEKPFEEKTDDDNTSTWVKPILKCEIQFASLASTGVYREPVFQRLVND